MSKCPTPSSEQLTPLKKRQLLWLTAMKVNLRQMTIQFLKYVGFVPGAKIWLRVSWDLPLGIEPRSV